MTTTKTSDFFLSPFDMLKKNKVHPHFPTVTMLRDSFRRHFMKF